MNTCVLVQEGLIARIENGLVLEALGPDSTCGRSLYAAIGWYRYGKAELVSSYQERAPIVDIESTPLQQMRVLEGLERRYKRQA